MGVLVDQVAEVVDITAEQIEPAPSFGTTVDTEFIMAMGKIGDDVVMLLEADASVAGIELVSNVSDDALTIPADPAQLKLEYARLVAEHPELQQLCLPAQAQLPAPESLT